MVINIAAGVSVSTASHVCVPLSVEWVVWAEFLSALPVTI